MRAFQFLTAAAAVALLAGVSAASAEPTDISVDDLNQTTTNTGTVRNTGDIDHNGHTIRGNGASLSISASGAISSLSVSSINAPEFDSIDVGTYGTTEIVSQTTTNHGNVTNIHGGDGQIRSGEIYGQGASISISATGGASAISLSSINNDGSPRYGNQVDFGGIQQTTVNTGDIVNRGGSVSAGNITGKGASVSIGASGAVSSVSVSSINDGNQIDRVRVSADINQTTKNFDSVTNTGNISVGNLSGAGASVSVSAVGAASAVSYSTIK